VADWLQPFDAMAADIYAARTGMDAGDIAKMLDRETWIGGSDAVDQGFADDLLPADQIETKAKNSIEGKAVSAMRKIDTYLARLNVPRAERKELVMALKGGTQDAAATSTQDAAVVAGVESLLSQIRSI
jgi:hypothetical protein